MWTDKTLKQYRLERGWPPLEEAESAKVVLYLNSLAEAFKELPSFAWIEPD